MCVVHQRLRLDVGPAAYHDQRRTFHRTARQSSFRLLAPEKTGRLRHEQRKKPNDVCGLFLFLTKISCRLEKLCHSCVSLPPSFVRVRAHRSRVENRRRRLCGVEHAPPVVPSTGAHALVGRSRWQVFPEQRRAPSGSRIPGRSCPVFPQTAPTALKSAGCGRCQQPLLVNRFQLIPIVPFPVNGPTSMILNRFERYRGLALSLSATNLGEAAGPALSVMAMADTYIHLALRIKHSFSGRGFLWARFYLSKARHICQALNGNATPRLQWLCNPAGYRFFICHQWEYDDYPSTLFTSLSNKADPLTFTMQVQTISIQN